MIRAEYLDNKDHRLRNYLKLRNWVDTISSGNSNSFVDNNGETIAIVFYDNKPINPNNHCTYKVYVS